MSAQKTFSIKEALKFGFSKTFGNFWFWIKILLSLVLFYAALGAFQYLFKDIAVLLVIFKLSSVVFGLLTSIGLAKITLNMSKGKAVSYKDLFSEYKLIPSAFLASFLYVLIVFFGLILFIVPGIIFAMKYRFFLFVLIEEDCGAIEALRKSAKITEGQKWNLFLFTLVGILLAPLLVITIIGHFVYTIADASLYCKLK